MRSTGKASWAILALFAFNADAVPTITFPINSQVPPVAKPSVLFTFTFSYATFTSTSPLTYTLSNAPSWLSLDAGSRTLSGTPPASAANTAPIIQITARDSTGATTMNTTLVVTGSSGPQVSIPLDSQIERFGPYSAPNSLLFYPSTPFKFSFDPNTFISSSGHSNGLNYYAVTLDNTPLPSWVNFDGPTLTFSGQTPDAGSLIQPPQNFGIQLIASEVLGFSGVTIPYHIVVENHKLLWADSFVAVNATPGSALNYAGLAGTLKLDGVVPAATNISSITAQTPSWLSFNNSTYAISGTPPADATSVNVTVTATDVFAGTAIAIVRVQVPNSSTSVFNTNDIGPINATIGMPFSHNFSFIVSNPTNTVVFAKISPATSWLSFDPSTLILSGQVPSSATASGIQITLEASTNRKRASQSLTFTLNVVSPTTSTGNTATPTQTPPSDTAITTAVIAIPANSSGVSTGALVAAILVPLLCLLAAVLVILFCCLSRRRKSKARAPSPVKSDISQPVLMDMQTPGGALIASEKQNELLRYGRGSLYTDAAFVGGRSRSRTLRRSQTDSGLHDFLSTTSVGESDDPHGIMARSFSEGALTNNSWRSTLDSGAYPAMNSQSAHSYSASNSSGRITRNFSRKAGSARLMRDDSSEFPIRNTNMSFVPFNPIAEASPDNNQQIPQFTFQDSFYVNKRRTPNYLGGVPNIPRRQSGIGHGSRDSNAVSVFSESVLSVMSGNRRSGGIGHGSMPSISNYTLARDETSWVTIDQHGSKRGRRPQSNMSALTESTDVLFPQSPERAAQRPTIRLVAKSPAVPPGRYSFSSSTRGRDTSSAVRRPGNSPFFGGSDRATSRAVSRRSDRSVGLSSDSRVNTSSDESATVPERQATNENLASSIMRQLRSPPPLGEQSGNFGIQRDPLGIVYSDMSVDPSGMPQMPTQDLVMHSSPREGTRQLQSYVSSLGWQRDSMALSEADSRFMSADHSPQSGFEIRADDEDEYSDGEDGGEAVPYGQSGYGRTYTHAGSPTWRDSRGEDRRYLADDESPEIGQAVETPYLAQGARLTVPEEFYNYRVGAERRPVSVDPHGLRPKQSLTASHYEASEGRPSVERSGVGASEGRRSMERGSDEENDGVAAFL